MDPRFLSMLIPIFVVGCVFGFKAFRQWLRFKERQLELSSTQAAEKAAQYAAKTERLEQRVAVLERILTDRSLNLSDEIERLRDSPLN